MISIENNDVIVFEEDSKLITVFGEVVFGEVEVHENNNNNEDDDDEKDVENHVLFDTSKIDNYDKSHRGRTGVNTFKDDVHPSKSSRGEISCVNGLFSTEWY
jgi:hypothetical protein